MTAIVSVPLVLTALIGSVLSRGVPIRSREIHDIDRSYLCAPLCLLAGLSWLFEMPHITVEYFETPAEAMAWVERDVQLRRLRSRLNTVARRLRELREERGV